MANFQVPATRLTPLHVTIRPLHRADQLHDTQALHVAQDAMGHLTRGEILIGKLSAESVAELLILNAKQIGA